MKELLLQHHNFYLNTCRKHLQESGVDVYTVKTDAFTIPNCRLEKAEEVLNLETVVGSWRFSRSDDIKYPLADEHHEASMAHPVGSISLKDEYDVDTTRRHFEERRRIMI